MKRRILIVLALAAVSFVVWRISTSSTAHTAGTGLSLPGNVDIREASLGFRVSGRIVSVLVEEGDAVTNNGVLAKIDPEPFARKLEAAKAQVEAAKARLDLMNAGYRTQEVAQARAVLRERTVFFENAQRLFERSSELLKSKTVSQQEFDDAEARFREAEARLNSAREQLTLLESGFRPEEIASAKAELEKAVAALSSAELELQDTTLRAPADGVILTRAQEPGAMVQAGATILTLSLENPVWVRAYIHEPDLGRIHPGMKVTITTDSHPEKPYEGQIGYISPRAEFTPRNVETKELRTSLVYRVRVIVSNPDKSLRQGMPAVVRLPAEQVDLRKSL